MALTSARFDDGSEFGAIAAARFERCKSRGDRHALELQNLAQGLPLGMVEHRNGTPPVESHAAEESIRSAWSDFGHVPAGHNFACTHLLGDQRRTQQAYQRRLARAEGMRVQ